LPATVFVFFAHTFLGPFIGLWTCFLGSSAR
jgi:hypothetical protein